MAEKRSQDKSSRTGGRTSASKKTAPRKTSTRKKATIKKVTSKKATRKKAARKQAIRTKATRKKATRKKATRKKATRKKSTRKASTRKASNRRRQAAQSAARTKQPDDRPDVDKSVELALSQVLTEGPFADVITGETHEVARSIVERHPEGPLDWWVAQLADHLRDEHPELVFTPLGTLRGVPVDLLVTDRPGPWLDWQEGLGLLVPYGVKRGFGSFAEDILSMAAWPPGIRAGLEQLDLQIRRGLLKYQGAPIAFREGSVSIIAASAERASEATARSAGIHMCEGLQLAGQDKRTIFATPILGTGVYELPPAHVLDSFFEQVAQGPRPSVERVIVIAREPHLVDTARAVFGRHADALRARPPANDSPVGEDLLDIETEVQAIAETIALQGLQPPFVVAVLGGWGAGKSFVLHLLEKRLLDIRCREPPDDQAERDQFPYVGHPYVIRFDAWTYAKADLWASLVRCIFEALDERLQLEEAVGQVAASAPRSSSGEPTLGAGEVYRVLGELTRDQRDRLRSSELGRLALDELARAQSGTLGGRQLWSKFEDKRAQETRALRESKLQLGTAQRKLQNAEHQREQARARAEQQRDAWHAAQRQAEDQRRRVAEAAAAARQREAAASVDADIREELASDRRTAVDALEGELRGALSAVDRIRVAEGQSLGDGLQEGLAPWREVVSLGDRLRLRVGSKPTSTWLVLTLAALAALGVTWLVDVLNGSEGMARLSGLLTAAGAVGTTVARRLRTAHAFLDDQEARHLRAREERRLALERDRGRRVAERLAKLEREAGAAADGAAPATPEEPPAPTDGEADDALIEQLRADVERLEAVVEHQRLRVGFDPDKQEGLEAFVRHRLTDEGYTERLGFMHQVQRDLDDLSEALLPHLGEHDTTLFPRGEPRIVLFVDDLDRCPPDKVVEVLEATQLLVKSRLFVVVLAMDVRYVTLALEKQYDRILTRDGSPTGLDYIEKIVQLPYRVRPVDEDSLRGFLEAQMLDPKARGAGPSKQASADGTAPATGTPGTAVDDDTPADDGTRTPTDTGEVSTAGDPPGNEPQPEPPRPVRLPVEAIEFTPEDVALLETCCMEVSVTPRAAKRLINVFKLLKIIWYRQSKPASDAMKRAALMLLALSARYPRVMREVLPELERQALDLERERPMAHAEHHLGEYVRATLEAQREGRDAQWQHVHEALAPDSPLAGPLDIGISDFGLRNIRLVTSFSFVGEPDR